MVPLAVYHPQFLLHPYDWWLDGLICASEATCPLEKSVYKWQLQNIHIQIHKQMDTDIHTQMYVLEWRDLSIDFFCCALKWVKGCI